MATLSSVPADTGIPQPPSTGGPTRVIDLRDGAAERREGDVGLVTRDAVAAPERSWPVVALVLLALLNVADVVSTRLVIGKGATERNPVAAWFLHLGGLGLAKATAVMAVAVLASRCGRARWVKPALWMVTGVYVTIVSVNVVQLFGVHLA